MCKPLWVILPCLVLVLGGLAACGAATPAAEPTPAGALPVGEDWARVQASGVLRVASPLDNPPFNGYSADFEPEGFEVALMEEVARRLGVTAEFEDYAYEGLLGALQLGQVDTVMAAMAITNDRLAAADFTQAYFQGEDAVLAAPASPITSVTTAADIASRRVGVQRGTVYETWIQRNLIDTGQMPAANLQVYSQPEDAIHALDAGRVDLVIVDRLPGLELQAQGLAKVVGKSLYVQEYAAAVRKGSSLLPQLNRVLTEVSQDGTVANLADRYLLVSAAPAPQPTATAAPPTLTPQPSPQPTATAAPALVDGVRYAADLTLDDGEMAHPPLVQPGQALQKGWRLLNSGTTTWSADYRLEYADGNTSVSDMGGLPVAVGRAVAPGQTADVYVNLVAPLAPYTYQGFWEMKNSAGVPFGQQVYVAVTVAGAPTPVPPPTATSVPGIWFGADRDHIAAGECATISWNVTNVHAVYFCVQGGNCQGVAGQAGQQVCPGATTTYELRVEQNDGRTDVRQLTIYVTPPANAPSITAFNVDRTSIRAGECVNLWWRVEGDASRIALVRDGAPLWDYAPANADRGDCPPGDGGKHYELQAWGPGGSGPAKSEQVVRVESAPAPQPETVQVGVEACGGGLNLRAGDTLYVVLRGPDGTGYAWEQQEVNPSVLMPIGPVAVQPGEGPGAEATYAFAYLAGPGETTLSLVWRRPSEGDAPPAEQCDIRATVR